MDQLYDLFAVVIHLGSHLNQGHYISLVRSHDFWLLYDDEAVEPVAESELYNYFGLTDDQFLYAKVVKKKRKKKEKRNGGRRKKKKRKTRLRMNGRFTYPHTRTLQSTETAYILFYQARTPAA